MSWHPVTPTIPHWEAPCQGWEGGGWGGPRPGRVGGAGRSQAVLPRRCRFKRGSWRCRMSKLGQVPIRFELPYDPSRIVAGHRYNLRARITDRGALRFISAQATLTTGGGSDASVVGPSERPDVLGTVPEARGDKSAVIRVGTSTGSKRRPRGQRALSCASAAPCPPDHVPPLAVGNVLHALKGVVVIEAVTDSQADELEGCSVWSVPRRW
jgi:hypothetical protein